MKLLRYVLLFFIALAPSFLQSKIIKKKSELELQKDAAKKSWENMAEKLFDVKTRFERLLEKGKNTPSKMKAKINEITDKRNKKLQELKEKMDTKKIKFSKYLVEAREIHEEYYENRDDLDFEKVQGTKDNIEHEARKQLDITLEMFFDGTEESATEELNEISTLEAEMENDIDEALGRWIYERPSGDDVEKKLTLLDGKFSKAMAAKYPAQDPEKIKEIEKLQKEEAAELVKLEKKKNIFTILIYLVKKEKLESDYKDKYEEIGGKAFMISAKWAEQINNAWVAWHEEDEDDYNDALKNLDKIIKDI